MFGARCISLLFLAASLVLGQGNGKLQLHFMDVGQGDGAVLISPKGEVVLFDNGVDRDCDRPISHLQQLGLTKIDYHIASHYHADHIGCTAEVLEQFPLQKDAFDRGGEYPSAERPSALFKRYLRAVSDHRTTPVPRVTKIVLDDGSDSPVEIRFVAFDGNGVETTNENDLSLVAVVHFGKFDAEFGGDLSGYDTGSYKDIETGLAADIGQVEVYKVHHHCSRYSSNEAWLAKIKPEVAIISTGDGNTYGHPAEECLERVHAVGAMTYWTEAGAGATPEPGLDVVSGNIIIEVQPGGEVFSVMHNGGQVEQYAAWESGGPEKLQENATMYAWSRKASGGGRREWRCWRRPSSHPGVSAR